MSPFHRWTTDLEDGAPARDVRVGEGALEILFFPFVPVSRLIYQLLELTLRNL